jgi:DNA polymerase III subunit delta
MTVLRVEEFDGFLKRKIAATNGLLLHGSDDESVGMLARQVIRAIAGDEGGSGAVLHVELSSLKENPSRILDEFCALSLLGERRILLVDGADDSILKFVDSILSATSSGNFLLMLAGSLGKTSKLRVACEQATLVSSLVIYEEDRSAMASRVRKLVADAGLSFLGDAEDLFFSVVGSDRSTINQELTKLLLYCFGQNSISEDDVLAICGDAATFGSDELVDAVLAGDLVKTDRMSKNLDGDQRLVLTSLLSHLSKLQALRMDIDNGMNADTAVRSSKPAIFFKRHPAVKNQLRIFELTELLNLQQVVASAILQTRKHADLGEALINRTALSIARTAAGKLN